MSDTYALTFTDIRILEAHITGVQLADGKLAVTLASLCEALTLRRGGQLARIHRQPLLRSGLQSISLQTPGGVQSVNVLIAWAVPLWLAGLQISRLPFAKRALVRALHHELIERLYVAFSPSNTSSINNAAPPEAMPVSPWETMYAALTRLEADAQAVNARLATLEAQVAQLQATEGHVSSLRRLLAATIGRLLEHERRLNGLKRRGLPPRGCYGGD